MTRARANIIVNDFFRDMNPTFWNGNGIKPATFDERVWEYQLSENDRLDISFQYDGVDGWYHCCEIVDNESNEMTEILSGSGIDSALNVADTIMELCKGYKEPSLDEEIMDVCEKIFDISAKHKLTYEEILEKIKKQID